MTFSTPEPFQAHDSVTGGCHVVILNGELDIVAAPQLEDLLVRLAADGTTGIVLDLRKLTFIDSSGLEAILLAKELTDENEYDFKVICGAPRVQRIFEVTGLSGVLPFEQDHPSTSLDGEPTAAGAGALERRADRPTLRRAPTGSRRPALPLGAASPSHRDLSGPDGGAPM